PNEGSPGGFLRNVDAPGQSFFRAPAKFNGDLSAAYGGMLSMDRRNSVDDPGDTFEAVRIQSGALTLVADIGDPGPDWGHVDVPLLPGFWRIQPCPEDSPMATEAEILEVLSNVTDLLIRAEYSTR